MPGQPRTSAAVVVVIIVLSAPAATAAATTAAATVAVAVAVAVAVVVVALHRRGQLQRLLWCPVQRRLCLQPQRGRCCSCPVFVMSPPPMRQPPPPPPLCPAVSRGGRLLPPGPLHRKGTRCIVLALLRPRCPSLPLLGGSVRPLCPPPPMRQCTRERATPKKTTGLRRRRMTCFATGLTRTIRTRSVRRTGVVRDVRSAPPPPPPV